MKMEELMRIIGEGESERVEFKERVSNRVIVDVVAFANAEGGYIVLGIDDDGNIKGIDTKKAKEYISNSIQSIIPPPKLRMYEFEIDGKKILVLKVNKSPTLCSIGGVAYIRIGAGVRPLSIQEIVMLSSEMGTINWDEMPIVDIDALRDDYLRWYFSRLEEARGRKIEEEDWERYLRSVKAIKNDKLTNAGVLFFTDADKHIPHSGGRILFMEGNEVRESREYTGPIWKVIEDMHSTLERELKKEEIIVGPRRKVISGYPMRAIREALINAFAHRNYAISADVRVFVYPQRIVIRNPGGLMPGVDIADPEHVPRNPVLCSLLYDTGYIERYGYGIRMMRSESEKYPWITLKFEPRSQRFDVAFIKSYEHILDDVDRKILEILGEARKSSEIARMAGISKPTAINHLKKLERLRLIIKKGSGAHIRYMRK